MTKVILCAQKGTYLGTADAKDKFEEIKNDFSIRVNELKQAILSASKNNDIDDQMEKMISYLF